jgi:HEAT repeat protein
MKAYKSLITAIVWIVAATALVARAADDPEETSLKDVLEELLPGMASDDLDARRGPEQEWQNICFGLGAPGNEARRAEACRAMADKLVPDTPAPARIWLLKQLQFIGRGECVDAVSAQLDDKDSLVRDAARRALAHNPSPEAGEMLRQRLKATTDNTFKVALINALDFRAEEANVRVLSGELRDSDSTVAGAAAHALGKLGTPPAAQALAAVRRSAHGDARLRISDGYLLCADRLLRAGKTAEAAAAYKELYQPDEPVRMAALKGLLNTAGDEAGTAILEILADDDAHAQRVAIGHVGELTAAAVRLLAAGLPKLPADGQVALLGALGDHKHRSTLPTVLAAVESEDENVKLAALRALGGVGDVSVVPVLVETMTAGGEPGDAARESLESIAAEGVDQKLIEVMKHTDDLGQRARFIEILDRRRAVAAVPALLQEALHEDANIRRRSMSALGRLGSAADVPGMVKVLLKIEDARERDDTQKAITSVCTRVPDENQRGDPVLAVYATANQADKNVVLPVLGRIGGPKALEQVRVALASGDAEHYDCAVRAISNWPDATVAEDLLKISESAKEETQRVRAVRALARVAVLPSDQPDNEKLALLKRTIERASRTEERNLILDRAKAIRRIETLRFVVPYLDDAETAQRACRTIIDLARHRGVREPNQAEFDKALQKVTQACKDRGLVDRAKGYMSAQ